VPEFTGNPLPATTPTTGPRRAILFTAFEPSGDDHASGVVAELRARHPELAIFAWGGPKMERAGATIVERTGDDAVMGLPGLAKIREHQRINVRIEEWLRTNPVAVHVPVDSPAANFPICAITRASGARVVHLVAPQIWAWGRWRIHKLRRLTDLVLCLLPFEEGFFTNRRVPARFIGHMLFDKVLDTEELDRRGAAFGDGPQRIAMMPGSRPDELNRHLELMLRAFEAIRAKHPQTVGVVAATTPRVADHLRELATQRLGRWPEAVQIVAQDTDAVIRWCTLALVKSGTVTLQVAKQNRPMVVFYSKSNPVLYFLAKTILSTKHFSLPNVLAHRRVVPEFIPHYGGPEPIVDAAVRLIEDPEFAAEQRRDLASVVAGFSGRNAASLAADAIEEIAGLRAPSSRFTGLTAAR
jgi:lipid-A-disaccharide synthase